VGKAAQVASEVGAITGVVAAEDVTGPYDVIARAAADSVDELGKMVVSRVQMIDGITRTLTCPVVHL
jgi:DNA-binding Lrp family transcriptional regulator